MAKKYVLGANAARKLRTLLNGKMSAGRLDGASGGMVDDGGYPLPFTVQWSASVNAWIIWLPGSEHVVVGSTSLNLATGMTAAGGDYPSGWYKLGALLDDDAGGTLYLVIDAEEETAALAGSASASGVSVVVCVASVTNDGARRVVPMLTSKVVIGEGTGGGGQTYYFADGFSLAKSMNVFHIAGFGRFHADGVAQVLGTFQSASELTIDDDYATDVAFLVRTPNSDTADLNQIGYRTLKFKKGEVAPSAFQYVTQTDPQTHQTVHKIVNCCFYHDGQLVTCQDYDATVAVLGNQPVYLVGSQSAPSEAYPETSWTWQVNQSQGVAPPGGKQLAYKLYDFANGKVAVDYRTSFLALEDHTQKAMLTIAAPAAGSKCVVINSMATQPTITIFDGTETDELVVSSVTVGDEEIARVLADTDFEIAQKQIVAGSNVTVVENGNQITISATGGGGGGGTSGFTGSRTVVVDVKYDEHKLWKKFATETWQDGVLKTSVEGTWEEYHEAVEETV